MAHQIAKLLLERAGTFLGRTKTIEMALSLGMPLNEVEEYLDWLDSVRPQIEQSSEPTAQGDQDESAEEDWPMDRPRHPR